MVSAIKVMNTKFAKLTKIYKSCIDQLFVWQSLNGSNFEFLNFHSSKPVFETLDGLNMKSHEYQVC
jgi:hypothetical protein